MFCDFRWKAEGLRDQLCVGWDGNLGGRVSAESGLLGPWTRGSEGTEEKEQGSVVGMEFGFGALQG